MRKFKPFIFYLLKSFLILCFLSSGIIFSSASLFSKNSQSLIKNISTLVEQQSGGYYNGILAELKTNSNISTINQWKINSQNINERLYRKTVAFCIGESNSIISTNNININVSFYDLYQYDENTTYVYQDLSLISEFNLTSESGAIISSSLANTLGYIDNYNQLISDSLLIQIGDFSIPISSIYRDSGSITQMGHYYSVNFDNVIFLPWSALASLPDSINFNYYLSFNNYFSINKSSYAIASNNFKNNLYFGDILSNENYVNGTTDVLSFVQDFNTSFNFSLSLLSFFVFLLICIFIYSIFRKLTRIFFSKPSNYTENFKSKINLFVLFIGVILISFVTSPLIFTYLFPTFNLKTFSYFVISPTTYWFLIIAFFICLIDFLLIWYKQKTVQEAIDASSNNYQYFKSQVKNKIYLEKDIANTNFSLESSSNLVNTPLHNILFFSRTLYEYGASFLRYKNIVSLYTSTLNCRGVALTASEKKMDNTFININQSAKFAIRYDLSKTKSAFKKFSYSSFSKKEINYWFEHVNPSYVVIYSVINLSAFRYIKKLCKKRNIKLFVDVVEFRKISFVSIKITVGYNFNNYFINKFMIDSSINLVTCPTTFLVKYFSKKVNNVFLLPITIDTFSTPKHNTFNSNKTVFLYAGNPEHKRDLIVNLIKSFILLPTNYQNKVHLYICGISVRKLLEDEQLPLNIFHSSLKFTTYLGRISREELSNIYVDVDFSILLKDPKKLFSKAGFPTKMTESLAFGVPMVCNLSGDMNLYMKNQYNCFVCPTYKPADFRDSLIKAIDSSSDNRRILSLNSLETVKKLDTKVFYNEFKEYFKNEIK